MGHRQLQSDSSSEFVLVLLGIVVGSVVVLVGSIYCIYEIIQSRHRNSRDTLTARLQAVRVETQAESAAHAAQPEQTTSTRSGSIAKGARRASTTDQVLATNLLPGLPATLSSAVSGLFRVPSEEEAVEEDPEVATREQEFYEQEEVGRAIQFIHRFVVREEACILIQSTWRFKILQTTVSVAASPPWVACRWSLCSRRLVTRLLPAPALVRALAPDLSHTRASSWRCAQAVRLRAVSAEVDREAQEADNDLQVSMRESGRESAVSHADVELGELPRGMSWFEKHAASSAEQASRAAEAADKVLSAAGAAKAAASSANLGERGRGVSGVLKTLAGDSTPSGSALLASLPTLNFRDRAKSVGPAGLDLDALESRAKRKADEAKRAKALAQAALVAAENARRRAEERLVEAKNRRDIKEQRVSVADSPERSSAGGAPQGLHPLQSAGSELGLLVGIATSATSHATGRKNDRLARAGAGGETRAAAGTRPGSSLCGCGSSATLSLSEPVTSTPDAASEEPPPSLAPSPRSASFSGEV